MVSNNSLNEPIPTSNKEVIEVTEDEFIAAPLESLLGVEIPIKYYIVNNTAQPIQDRELRLNEYLSDISLNPEFDVAVIGYLNLSTYVLDTSGIEYANSTVTYPTTRPRLSKPLPANSAYVITINPKASLSANVLPGSVISLYPLLSRYGVQDNVADWGEGVNDLTALKALTSNQYKNLQSRLVKSVAKTYYFDSTSVEADNGLTVISPDTNPSSGRWVLMESNILPGSIGISDLSSDVLEQLSGEVVTAYINIDNPGTYNLNLNTETADYFIVECPINNITNTPTVINPTLTLTTNNSTYMVLLELRQKTSNVSIDPSYLFPGGNIPILSGNTKTDLIAITIVRDNNGTVKKRAYLIQKDIG